MWHIFFIMWISGSGKWTLIKNLKNADIKEKHIPLSYKTRPIREHETDWVDSYFISREEFEKSIKNKEFLEYAIPYDWNDYYGTKYVDVIDNWIKKSRNVIKEIDINWLKRLKKQRPELSDFYSTIFLDIPDSIVKQRIEKRWESMEKDDFERRKHAAKMEKDESRKECDYIIDATKTEIEVLDEALKIINTIIWKSI